MAILGATVKANQLLYIANNSLKYSHFLATNGLGAHS